jgi:lysophospholipase L1-like esterase
MLAWGKAVASWLVSAFVAALGAVAAIGGFVTWVLGALVLTALALVVGLLFYVQVVVADSAAVSADEVHVLAPESDTESAVQIVALGDSFMSGEGAPSFFAGTDLGSRDLCRRAPTAYPVVVAEHLAEDPPPGWDDAHLTFVACSGARTVNIGSSFQDVDARPTQQFPDESLQIEALRSRPDADVVILGMGGNDAGFSQVVLTCAGHRASCEELAGPWLASLDPGSDVEPNKDGDGQVFAQQSLRDVMRQARELAPHARYYVTTYPNPVSAGECPKVGLDKAETRFISHTFLPQLNGEIALAANLAGFEVIDLYDVFDGKGLCADGPDDDGLAMNGWHKQKIDHWIGSPNQLLHGSFHPTPSGHALIAAKVEAVLRSDLLKDPPNIEPSGPDGCALPGDAPGGGPTSGPPGGPPDGPPEGSPETGGPTADPDTTSPPDCPTTTPPGLPTPDVPFPVGPWPLRDNPCSPEAQRNDNVQRPPGPLRVTGARPGSTLCFAGYADDFHIGVADAAGTFTVPTADAVSGLGGRREAIFQTSRGVWVWRIEWSPPSAPPSKLNLFDAWLGLRDGPWQMARPLLYGVGGFLALLLLLGAAIKAWRSGTDQPG